ncbi:uncharacterized protein CARINH isoform X2 [Macaca nemestrina]|uniref:uncharacterized protein CARINH isoform X2 n=1 Tax=Macaca nemestrina TaxID=9545 RepID=UPI0039B8231D
MEEPVPVWRERRGRLSAYRGPAQPPVQPGPGSRRGRCARRTRSRALGGTELHPERHRAGHAQTRARGPRLWLPARARPRSRLPEVFAFAFLPMSLRKMKVVVSRTGAAAVPGEGRRMRRRPAWSAGPGAPAQGEVAAHPGPPGSPEDGQQRNKKMDSLAAGELNASHQPWVPELVAHWRKTHQGTNTESNSWQRHRLVAAWKTPAKKLSWKRQISRSDWNAGKEGSQGEPRTSPPRPPPPTLPHSSPHLKCLFLGNSCLTP